MKKLLVLTDFTANARHAEAAAVRICVKLKMDMLLYHSTEEVTAIPAGCQATFVVGANQVMDDNKVKLLGEVESLKRIAIQKADYLPTISFISGEDSFKDDIKRLTERPEIYLVIVGGRSGKKLDSVLFGSKIKEVVENSLKPVLIIPEGTHTDELKKVVFATDFAKGDKTAVHSLIALTRSLGLNLEAVHVVKPGELYEDFDHELSFRTFLEQEGVPYETLFGNMVAPRLKAHCYQTGVGLLAMTHGHHSWVSRLFGHSLPPVILDATDNTYGQRI
ncbi:MAG: universal stress protein [Mucilaginibacter sp.]|uniref:universal stress protein n=1 Tax=Mucilaginibacter sp. TaxID=1882438 RepID=UPI0031A3EC2F